MPRRVNLIKIKCVDQRFWLRYTPKNKDYRWVVGVRRNKRMAEFEGRKLEEEDLVIPLIRVSF